MKAAKRLKDILWIIEFEIINDYSVRIVSYAKDTKAGWHQREQELPKGELLEGDERIAEQLWLEGEVYQIINPRHIYDYKPESEK